MSSGISERLSRWALPVGAALTALSASVYTVDGGQRAVIFDRIQGVKRTVKGEGLHVLIPWLQQAILFDVRTKPRSITSTTGSRDMQTVSLTLRVLSRPDCEHLPDIYTKLGTDYDERVLPSIANEVLKAIVAQFNAGELITQRELVSARIREELIPRAADFHIRLEDVSLTHLNFGTDFTKAVEEKQIAQQETETVKFFVERAEHEKNAAIKKAEGEAEAATLIANAMQTAGNGLVQLRRIEAAKEIAETLSTTKNVSFLPTSGGHVDLLLNMATAPASA